MIYQAYANLKSGKMGVRKIRVKKETKTRYYDVFETIYNKEDMDKIKISFYDISILVNESNIKNALSRLLELLENRRSVLEDMCNRIKNIDDNVIENIKSMETQEPLNTSNMIKVTEDML